MKFQTLARLALLAGLAVRGAVPALAAAEGAPTREPKTLRATIDAAKLHELQLQAGEGTVDVRISPDDAVHVEVVVAPGRRGVNGFADRVRSWFLASRYKEDADLVRAAEIMQEVNGGTLELDLTPELSTRKDRVHERWTVEVPARFEVGLRMDVGDASIAGAAGGVRARVSVGTIAIDVPAGDVDARISVGDVRVHTGAPAVGDVLVDADVGDADLWVDGGRVEHDNAPGPGGRVALRGSSGVTIRATAEVGDASVRIRH